MMDTRKIFGVVVLIAFALTAVSVVCSATAQASVMGDCGNGMAPAAICPFMSASVPAVVGVSPIMKVLGLMMALGAAAIFMFGFSFANDRAKKLFISAYERKRDVVTGRRTDTVLNLISDGILHARVFNF